MTMEAVLATLTRPKRNIEVSRETGLHTSVVSRTLHRLHRLGCVTNFALKGHPPLWALGSVDYVRGRDSEKVPKDFSFRVPLDLYRRINHVRGLCPRTSWVTMALRLAREEMPWSTKVHPWVGPWAIIRIHPEPELMQWVGLAAKSLKAKRALFAVHCLKWATRTT